MRDGPRDSPCKNEHVHRSVQERKVRDCRKEQRAGHAGRVRLSKALKGQRQPRRTQRTQRKGVMNACSLEILRARALTAIGNRTLAQTAFIPSESPARALRC